MYTPYVGFAGILLDIHVRIRKVNYVKIKGIPFVIDLRDIFTTTYGGRQKKVPFYRPYNGN